VMKTSVVRSKVMLPSNNCLSSLERIGLNNLYLLYQIPLKEEKREETHLGVFTRLTYGVGSVHNVQGLISLP